MDSRYSYLSRITNQGYDIDVIISGPIKLRFHVHQVIINCIKNKQVEPKISIHKIIVQVDLVVFELIAIQIHTTIIMAKSMEFVLNPYNYHNG